MNGASPAAPMIAVLGDCHGHFSLLERLVHVAAVEHGAIAAIQVGDFGWLRDACVCTFDHQRMRFTIPLHVIDGNHENHEWLASRRGSKDRDRWQRSSNLIYHPRGDVAEIGRFRFGFCGGALHADHPQKGDPLRRTTNWVTDQEGREAAGRFSLAGVDVVVTHSCPHSIGIGMRGNPRLDSLAREHIAGSGFDGGPPDDVGEPGLTALWRSLQTKPRTWLFGHFHQHRRRVIESTTFICVGAIDGSGPRPDTRIYLIDLGGPEPRVT